MYVVHYKDRIPDMFASVGSDKLSTNCFKLKITEPKEIRLYALIFPVCLVFVDVPD